MSAHNVARRYANALLMLSVDAGEVEKVREQVAALGQLMRTSAEFRIVMESPVIDLAQRHGVIRAVATSIGLRDSVRNFLLLLADRKRLSVLPQIADVFDDLADEHLGIVRARVETPIKLNPVQEQTLRGLLEKRFGRKVRLEQQLDERILGGFRVAVGSTVIDATVDARLTRLRDTILGEL